MLEALFFRQHGIRSVSLSYAQQTHSEQDREAVAALRRLCRRAAAGRATAHVVVYAYMGVYPPPPRARTACWRRRPGWRCGGRATADRQDRGRGDRIPTVAENVAALEHAAAVAAAQPPGAPPDPCVDSQTYAEAVILVDAVRALHPDLGQALLLAFRRGYLDIPYCLHPDNAGRARSAVDADGRLHWTALGSLPLTGIVRTGATATPLTSGDLLAALSGVRARFDGEAIGATPERPGIGASPESPGIGPGPL